MQKVWRKYAESMEKVWRKYGEGVKKAKKGISKAPVAL